MDARKSYYMYYIPFVNSTSKASTLSLKFCNYTVDRSDTDDTHWFSEKLLCMKLEDIKLVVST